jgi:hypothetical protein
MKNKRNNQSLEGNSRFLFPFLTIRFLSSSGFKQSLRGQNFCRLRQLDEFIEKEKLVKKLLIVCQGFVIRG